MRRVSCGASYIGNEGQEAVPGPRQELHGACITCTTAASGTPTLAAPGMGSLCLSSSRAKGAGTCCSSAPTASSAAAHTCTTVSCLSCTAAQAAALPLAGSANIWHGNEPCLVCGSLHREGGQEGRRARHSSRALCVISCCAHLQHCGLCLAAGLTATCVSVAHQPSPSPALACAWYPSPLAAVVGAVLQVCIQGHSLDTCRKVAHLSAGLADAVQQAPHEARQAALQGRSQPGGQVMQRRHGYMPSPQAAAVELLVEYRLNLQHEAWMQASQLEAAAVEMPVKHSSTYNKLVNAGP